MSSRQNVVTRYLSHKVLDDKRRWVNIYIITKLITNFVFFVSLHIAQRLLFRPRWWAPRRTTKRGCDLLRNVHILAREVPARFVCWDIKTRKTWDLSPYVHKTEASPNALTRWTVKKQYSHAVIYTWAACRTHTTCIYTEWALIASAPCLKFWRNFSFGLKTKCFLATVVFSPPTLQK